MQIPGAWSISRGAGATVAVLDTGVAYESRGGYRRAPDLAATRFVPGWDFVDDDPHPRDEPPRDGRRSHGTQMAAIVAQTAGNGIGGAGVAPAAAIMPVRVLRPDLTGSAADIARGIRYAVDHGADVVNLSIAGARPARALSKAIAYAAAKRVTVVGASGNEGAPRVGWPAAYPSVLAVGAVNRQLNRAPYSNYGRPLDLVAPAGDGDQDDDGYGPAGGVVSQTLKGGPARFCFCFTASTSAAAAEVSGVAALLVGSRRATRPGAIRATLLSSARDLGARGRDVQYGSGLVQAQSALLAGRAPSGTADGGATHSGSSTRLWLGGIGCAALAALIGVGVLTRRKRGTSV
jgi:serine protease